MTYTDDLRIRVEPGTPNRGTGAQRGPVMSRRINSFRRRYCTPARTRATTRRSERVQRVLERREIGNLLQAYGAVGLHERVGGRDQTGDLRLRVVLQLVQRRYQLLQGRQEMPEIFLQHLLLFRRH